MDAARPCVLLVISLAVVPAVSAGISLDDFGGSLGLTSDYVNHGISQTCGDPAAQGDVHYRSAGGRTESEAFAGAWGSVGLGQSPCGKSREVNFYAGYSFVVGQESSAALTYTHYGYPGGSYTIAPLGGYRYDYDSLEAQWAWQDQLYLTLAWTPDALRFEDYSPYRDRSAVAFGAQLHHPLPGGFTLSAGLGYDQIPDPSGAGYAFWNAGVGYALGPVQLQAGYFGTADRAQRVFGTYVAGNRASVSAVWRF
jgi:uncharacterized protein (TIGR02001 family)